MKITSRNLVTSAKDYGYVSDRLHETRARVSEHIAEAMEISHSLRLLGWLLRHDHQLQESIEALHSVGLHARHGRRWTVARLESVVRESAAVVEQVVAGQDEFDG